MTLRKLFDKYKCDKSSKHGYEAVYQPEFEPIREEKINVLEIGIFKGASTAAFLEYMPNATFYGIDIFTRMNPNDVDVLNHDRVNWLKGDSTSIGIGEQVRKKWGDVKFDIVIDDGLHTPEANGISFRNLSPFLSDTGAYYIEDVFPLDIMTMKESNHPWIKQNSQDLNILKFEMFLKELEGWNIEKFDLRKKSKQPESYIYKMTK